MMKIFIMNVTHFSLEVFKLLNPLCQRIFKELKGLVTRLWDEVGTILSFKCFICIQRLEEIINY
jgi:hypothetical protein